MNNKVQIADLQSDALLVSLDEKHQCTVCGGGWENDGVFDDNDAAIVGVLIGVTPNINNLWDVRGLSQDKIQALATNPQLVSSLQQRLPDVHRYLFG